MLEIDEQQFNRLCWLLVSQSVHSQYSYFDIRVTPEEERDEYQNEEERYRSAGMANGYIDIAEFIDTNFDVDLVERAKIYAHEADVPFYPFWVTDEGYEPDFRRTPARTFIAVSERDEEMYLE